MGHRSKHVSKLTWRVFNSLYTIQSILRMWSVDNLQLLKEWFLIYFLTSYFHRAQILFGWSGPICCIAMILISFDCIFSQLSLRLKSRLDARQLMVRQIQSKGRELHNRFYVQLMISLP